MIHFISETIMYNRMITRSYSAAWALFGFPATLNCSGFSGIQVFITLYTGKI